MAFYQPLNVSHINFPEWHWHGSQFMSHIMHLHKPHHGPAAHKAHVSFDVRETDGAYFLDGEFPGVGHTEDIKMEWTGKRTLSVEAKLSRVDIEKEWDIVLPKEEAQHETEEVVDDDLTLHRCDTPEEVQAPSSPPSEAKETNKKSNDKPKTQRTNSGGSQSSRDSRRSSISVEGLKKRLSFGSKSGEKRKPTHKPTTRYVAPPLRTLASERHTGEVKRVFSFPEDVDHDSLKARLNQGLLRVMVTKVEPMKPKPVPIEVFPAYFAM